MGGGNPPSERQRSLMRGLSPRGRGKPIGSIQIQERAGSIPAWAGETAHALVLQPAQEVYPRVGGGNSPQDRRLQVLFGLSPRGRGKRDPTAPIREVRRSIPAWAGETPVSPRTWATSTVYPRVGGGNVVGGDIA